MPVKPRIEVKATVVAHLPAGKVHGQVSRGGTTLSCLPAPAVPLAIGTLLVAPCLQDGTVVTQQITETAYGFSPPAIDTYVGEFTVGPIGGS